MGRGSSVVSERSGRLIGLGVTSHFCRPPLSRTVYEHHESTNHHHHSTLPPTPTKNWDNTSTVLVALNTIPHSCRRIVLWSVPRTFHCSFLWGPPPTWQRNPPSPDRVFSSFVVRDALNETSSEHLGRQYCHCHHAEYWMVSACRKSYRILPFFLRPNQLFPPTAQARLSTLRSALEG